MIRSLKFRMLVRMLKPLFDAILINIAIQGRDCLVQKFRNSSVMLEHPGFRPKVTNFDDFLVLYSLNNERYSILAKEC